MLTSERLGESAAELTAIGQSLEARGVRLAIRSACLRRVAVASGEWWAGPRAIAYRNAAARIDEPLTPVGAAIADAHRVVALTCIAAGELARRLATIERSLADQHALLHRLRLAGGGQWSSEHDEAHGHVRRLERERQDVVTEWSARCRSAAAAVEHVAVTLPQIAEQHEFTLAGAGPMIGVIAHGAGAVPDAAAVARWWQRMPPSTRRALIAMRPSVIGNLDGVPIDVRVVANRHAMQAALDRADPRSDEWRRLHQFTDPERPDRVDPTRQFIVFDPTGDGVIAEVFGDLVTAGHAAVLVPGMGSTLAGFHDLADRAARLHQAAGADSAVIAWTGYDTPNRVSLSSAAIEVVSDRQARVGGRRLHALVDGLRLETPASLTLIGHSYGSLAVGQALLDGAEVERVVFMGSPGVGVDHIRDFPVGAADEFFASEIKGDVVATLEHFGTDPTDPDFGAEVFDSGDGDGFTPFSRHAEYYDDGIAIDNLATILTGRTPSPGRTDLIEYLTEPMEDLYELHDATIERLQQYDIPYADDTVVDLTLEATQRVTQITDQVRQVLVEEVGHFGQDAVEWGADRLSETWSDGTDVVTGWFR